MYSQFMIHGRKNIKLKEREYVLSSRYNSYVWWFNKYSLKKIKRGNAELVKSILCFSMYVSSLGHLWQFTCTFFTYISWSHILPKRNVSVQTL